MADKVDPRTYKPELLTLDDNQQDAVNKYSVVADTEIGKLIVVHMQTEFINKMLFPNTKQEALEAIEIQDPYFRGMLEGMALFYTFIHERAEIASNPSFNQR